MDWVRDRDRFTRSAQLAVWLAYWLAYPKGERVPARRLAPALTCVLLRRDDRI